MKHKHKAINLDHASITNFLTLSLLEKYLLAFVSRSEGPERCCRPAHGRVQALRTATDRSLWPVQERASSLWAPLHAEPVFACQVVDGQGLVRDWAKVDCSLSLGVGPIRLPRLSSLLRGRSRAAVSVHKAGEAEA